ncbi:protoporphyrinogen oxidase [Bdellovibrionota bacterium FG-2]
MLGTLNRDVREATVVGAGISGLLAAYHLDRAGFEVTLIEAQAQTGGLIRTLQMERGISETGAHSLLLTPLVREFCDEIGVELAPVNKDSKARYILRNGKMRKIPLSPWEILKTLFRAYFVLADPKADPFTMPMSQWANRFLGPAASQFVFSPFVRGIYGADLSEISVGAAFPMLVVQPGHSLISQMISKKIRGKKNETKALVVTRAEKKGAKGMVAPREGMGALVTALTTHLEKELGSRFQKGTPVTTLPKVPNLILAVPAYVASQLIGASDNELALVLRQIEYSPMVAATAFVPKYAMPVTKGVGVLVAPGEPRGALGILFNSSSFPGRVKDESQWCSFTLMAGGGAGHRLLTQETEELESMFCNELHEVLQVKEERLDEVAFALSRWEKALPKYDRKLQNAWAVARAGWCSKPGQILCGNYSGQISLRGMIEDSRRMVE